jgi:hypothetical protein
VEERKAERRKEEGRGLDLVGAEESAAKSLAKAKNQRNRRASGPRKSFRICPREEGVEQGGDQTKGRRESE